ncbi:MAG: hypothetical protein JSS02_08330 [Planctomycetes bacterium]|nr:hypothetical protein [Planctomycetota bacterium]
MHQGRLLQLACRIVLAIASLATLTGLSVVGADERLAGTEQLTLERPADELMVAGLRQFCLRELAASPARRDELWQPHRATRALLQAHVAACRERLKSSIGATDRRVTSDPAAPVAFELLTTLEQSSVVARTDFVTVHRVRWPVLEGVSAEGLLLVPQTVRAGVVALPDADWTPEMFCGLAEGLADSAKLAKRFAEAGCLVVIPTLISRRDEHSGHADVTFTNQPHREFLYRQAFEVGRHVIGYEVQKTLAAVDLLERTLQSSAGTHLDGPRPIGVVGVGEGGLLALYAAAIDPRIQACWISGHFQQRESIWQEPIYRNVWGLLNEFGDAELAGMVAPRRLVIEAAHAVTVTGPPAARPGRASVAAPGVITTCHLDSVRAEVLRAVAFYRVYEQEPELRLVAQDDQGAGDPGANAAFEAFATGLSLAGNGTAPAPAWQPVAPPRFDPESLLAAAGAREARQFQELQTHVQNLLFRSHQARDARWRKNPTSRADWERQRLPLQNWVHDELIGRAPQTRKPPRPRSRRVRETDRYVCYEIVLDVYDDVIATGLLLLPRHLSLTKKHPVVVCQHGLEGTPYDTISREPGASAIYRAFSEELVHQGFIVYAPQNPYRGGDRFRVLQRMSQPLGRTLFSYIIAQHEQTLDWLETLPFVDSHRIGFYGISYGGKTAMRVPPLVDRYRLAICSGDFTDWPRTLISNNERFSYLFTSEYEVFEWNLAHVANYAELAMLMAPRPFIVEAGHRDGGQPSDWVAGEFGKVRRHYDQLGLTDRAVLEFFDGPHTIHGQGTFRFLHEFLDQPVAP